MRDTDWFIAAKRRQAMRKRIALFRYAVSLTVIVLGYRSREHHRELGRFLDDHGVEASTRKRGLVARSLDAQLGVARRLAPSPVLQTKSGSEVTVEWNSDGDLEVHPHGR